ncbi:Dimer-Tnp-hAT domain-containing protein [Mycena sanguinolenta]|uniref:Dimer-Tnp-hAT domain-containing protein n=1 Tax=Mycena sanguinolenta TaxID=230812 RepID=A0A8H6Z5F6_9AGAR|nr:Dimer-Tnp-hAT domain-containing protein [Mycena sanguinolenta]
MQRTSWLQIWYWWRTPLPNKRRQDTRQRPIIDFNFVKACEAMLGRESDQCTDERYGNTSDRRQHLRCIWRQEERPAVPSDRTLTPAELRAHLVRWVAESNRPLAIVEDREFRSILGAGRPEFSLPGRRTVARDLSVAFGIGRAFVEKLLREHEGRLNFATDAWTSPNHRAFLAWTVHLHHEGRLLSFPLDVYEVPESHTGRTLAREFDDMLSRFNIGNKILSWTGDNATSNDTQNVALASNPNNDFESVNRVRCFAHTLNLAVSAFLRPFTPEKKKKKGKEKAAAEDEGEGSDDEAADDDGDGPDALVLEDDDADDLPDLVAVSDDDILPGYDDVDTSAWDEMDEDAKATPMRDVSAVKVVISLICGLAFAIVNSPTKGLPAWLKKCGDHGMTRRLIPRDVRTRWNSLYDMLVVAIMYKKVVNDFMGDRELGFRAYDLTDVQWTLLGDMVHVLKVFKDATLYFSSESHCTITQVIPTMDRIDDLITATIVSPSRTSGPAKRALHPSILSALQLAKSTLNKYYSHTDSSNVYRIAMILHPNYKLDYFRSRKWESEWISTAEELVRDEFKTNYASTEVEGAPALADDTSSDGGVSPRCLATTLAHGAGLFIHSSCIHLC